MPPSSLPHPGAEDEPLGSTPAKFNHLRHNSHSSPALGALASTPSSSRTPSTSRSRSTTKRSVQEHFSEDAMREDEMLDRLRLQKHERTIATNDLKRRKLEHKLLEAQHRREREREQHELRMLQMRLMMQGGQGGQGGQRAASVMQPPAQQFGGLGLMDELNGDVGPSAHPFTDTTHYSI